MPRRSQRLEVLQGWERAGMLRTLLSSNKDIAIPRDLGDEAEEDPLRGALITDLMSARLRYSALRIHQ